MMAYVLKQGLVLGSPSLGCNGATRGSLQPLSMEPSMDMAKASFSRCIAAVPEAFSKGLGNAALARPEHRKRPSPTTPSLLLGSTAARRLGFSSDQVVAWFATFAMSPQSRIVHVHGNPRRCLWSGWKSLASQGELAVASSGLFVRDVFCLWRPQPIPCLTDP